MIVVGAGAGRVRAQVQLVRVLLAGACSGLAGAVFIGSASVAQGAASRCCSGCSSPCVGMENPAAHPRFTFGIVELLGGVNLIPMMVGMFAVSEILRYVVGAGRRRRGSSTEQIGNVFTGMWGADASTTWRRCCAAARSARSSASSRAPGADMAAWMSYAMSKRFSKEPEKFGTGHVEGIVEAGAANNCVARRRLDPGAGVRHPRRLDHRHRDRRALPEGHESRARRSSSTTRRTSTRSSSSSSSPTC